MPGLYSHTTRATGTVLTAAIYNADHQNHIDNHVPLMIDDYSVNATEMQTATDPGEVGSESLATSLAGELARLRFAIKELKDRVNGAAVGHWYVTATGDLAVADGGTGASSASGARTNLGLGAAALLADPIPLANGGTGQTTATAAFNALDPLTTKGDVIVHNGTDSVRLAVGANNKVLMADSAQTNGVKWEVPNAFQSITSKSATFNITSADKGAMFECTSAFTITLDAIASFDSTFYCYISNVSTGTIVIDPNAAEQISVAGASNGGSASFSFPTSSASAGPFNVQAVMLYKSGGLSAWQVLPISQSHGIIHFTSNGTFEAPRGVRLVWVTGQGGGGAGGGAASATSLGGKGGSSGVGTIKQAIAVDPGTSYAVTIGNGGTGVSGGNGLDGSSTSLGALLTLAGGTGGTADAFGVTLSAGNYSNASSLNSTSHGGTGGPGLGGGAGAGGIAGIGFNGKANSGGGGGGAGGNSVSNFAGGNGGSGFLTIEW